MNKIISSKSKKGEIYLNVIAGNLFARTEWMSKQIKIADNIDYASLI